MQAEQRVPTLVVSSDDLDTPEENALTTQSAGTHADDIETSMILALRPDLVRMDRAVKDTRDSAPGAYPGYRPGDFVRRAGDPNYSTTGIFGDPTLATAEKGRRVLELRTRQWLSALRGFSTAPLPNGREE
jgi:creatinine amidohydrolase